MKEFTADEAQRDFGRVMAESGRAPVRVTSGDEAVVVLPADAYERFRRLHEADVARAKALLDEIGAYATAQGLTDEVLAAILADED